MLPNRERRPAGTTQWTALKALAATALSLATTACAGLPGLEDPRPFIAGRYATLRVRGNTDLQSPGTPPTTNPAIGLDELGLGKTEDEIGGTIGVGDGFSGLEIDVLHVDRSPSSAPPLGSGYGALQAGDQPDSELKLTEYRLTYRAALYETEFDVQDSPMTLQVGLGGSLIYREMDLESVDGLGGTGRNIDITTNRGVIYQPSVRARGTWNNVGLTLDFGYSDDFATGGDWNGENTDLRIEGSYEFPSEAVTVFAAWSRSEFEASGESGGLLYNHDLTVDGFSFGARYSF